MSCEADFKAFVKFYCTIQSEMTIFMMQIDSARPFCACHGMPFNQSHLPLVSLLVYRKKQKPRVFTQNTLM